VSLYLPDTTGPATWHEIGNQTAYVSQAGDFTGATAFPTQATTEARYWLSGVDVMAPRRAFSVVAFGDSITDGWGSTLDANHRWPDYFSERLNGGPGPFFGRVGVLNQGISGNRLLNDFMGPSALTRFDRDVLAQPGAEHVIIMVGINDIGFPGAFGLPESVTADEIIDGLSQLISRARAHGLRVYGGTLTPFEGTTFPGYYTPEGEAKRQAVNHWIRTGAPFDAVFDFDAVLRDPDQPTQLLPAFDSGDHLHPSDAGYEAMADAIDLDLFLPRRG
jgi:lysophospholipase L1-like esterase